MPPGGAAINISPGDRRTNQSPAGYWGEDKSGKRLMSKLGCGKKGPPRLWGAGEGAAVIFQEAGVSRHVVDMGWVFPVRHWAPEFKLLGSGKRQ